MIMSLSSEYQNNLLHADDPPPAEYLAPTQRPEILIICEHAGLAIPKRLDRLGFSSDFDLSQQHIAWDIGGASLSRKIADQLGAGLIWQNYSRLVIDCNRRPLSPQSIREESDHVPIPGNIGLSAAEKQARVDEIFQPYDNLCRREMARPEIKLVVCIHSFTAEMDGFSRPWHMSFLYRNGGVYARQMASFILADDPDLIIGFNEPYQVDDQTDWFVIQHAEPKGVPQVLIEVRNDQLRKDVDIDQWAKRLSDACLKMLS